MINKWHDVITIPNYLVQRIGDSGMVESIDNNDEIEKDDLRVSIELSGGMIIVLPTNSRIVINNEGDFIIERTA